MLEVSHMDTYVHGTLSSQPRPRFNEHPNSLSAQFGPASYSLAMTHLAPHIAARVCGKLGCVGHNFTKHFVTLTQKSHRPLKWVKYNKGEKWGKQCGFAGFIGGAETGHKIDRHSLRHVNWKYWQYRRERGREFGAQLWHLAVGREHFSKIECQPTETRSPI